MLYYFEQLWIFYASSLLYVAFKEKSFLFGPKFLFSGLNKYSNSGEWKFIWL